MPEKLPFVVVAKGQHVDPTTFPDGTYALIDYRASTRLIGMDAKNAFPWDVIVVQNEGGKTMNQVREDTFYFFQKREVDKVYIASSANKHRAELDRLLADLGIELVAPPVELLKFSPTKRGFDRYKFTDRAGSTCSLQKSSVATEDCIWLGVDEVFDHSNARPARMHLSQEQVAALLPDLEHFARTGELKTP
jgi:hypothetical protein